MIKNSRITDVNKVLTIKKYDSDVTICAYPLLPMSPLFTISGDLHMRVLYYNTYQVFADVAKVPLLVRCVWSLCHRRNLLAPGHANISFEEYFRLRLRRREEGCGGGRWVVLGNVPGSPLFLE